MTKQDDDGMPLPNNRPERRRFKAKQFREHAVEQLGLLACVELELDDGSVVLLPHPLTLDGDQYKRFRSVEANEDLDPNGVDEDGNPTGEPDLSRPQVDGKFVPFAERVARAVLGDAEYERAAALGLRAEDVSLAFRYLSSAGVGSSPDGDDPKRRKS